jgi:hypothetical protein
MKGKAGGEKEFDKVHRGMLATRPLSRAQISARIRARSKTRQKSKQSSRPKNSRS